MSFKAVVPLLVCSIAASLGAQKTNGAADPASQQFAMAAIAATVERSISGGGEDPQKTPDNTAVKPALPPTGNFFQRFGKAYHDDWFPDPNAPAAETPKRRGYE